MVFFIDASPPEGEWYCDVCNATCGENNIATQDCELTDWGLYCTECADKYRDKKGISGGAVIAKFRKDEEIKTVSES